MAYSLGIDYSNIENLKRKYRATYGVDAPASVISQWVEQEMAPAYESHIREARSATELGLGKQRLGLLKKEYELQREREGAEVTASRIQLGTTAASTIPTLYEFGKGLLPKATPQGVPLTSGVPLASATPTATSSFGATMPMMLPEGVSGVASSGIPLTVASATPTAAESIGALGETGATQGASVGMGATLPVVGWAGLGALGGGLIGQQVGGKTGKVVGEIGGGAAAGAIAGSPVPGIGTGFGAIIGGVIGALKSLF